ncbi:hypothetical protein BDZ91DRAFT_815700 [Kalaharituber pfeilii]|nr:hypothetical protein BDZ91DRAFT_815700 [Kalaharituber pfeilii]
MVLFQESTYQGSYLFSLQLPIFILVTKLLDSMERPSIDNPMQVFNGSSKSPFNSLLVNVSFLHPIWWNNIYLMVLLLPLISMSTTWKLAIKNYARRMDGAMTEWELEILAMINWEFEPE